MNRAWIAVLAALGTVALLAAAVVASGATSSKTTKVKTRVTLKYEESGSPPYNQAAFTGRVKGKKGCNEDRKVKVVQGIGKTKSGNNGKYRIDLGSPAAPGTYTAKVKKKTITEDGDRIVCKKAKSKPLTVS
jgi:hypothetical protein